MPQYNKYPCRRKFEQVDVSIDGDVLPFPAQVFPEVVRKFVEEAAESCNCPVDFVAVPTLVTMGAAIGSFLQVEVKGGWTELPQLWAAVVGETGSGKSPALKHATKPLANLQRRMSRENKERRQEPGRDNPITRVPPRQAMTTDVTTEALSELMDANPRGVTAVRDELAGWMRGMNEYKARGRGSDRAFYLSLWSGSPVAINRKTLDVPICIDKPFVAVAGCIQPDMLSEFDDERGREDGFIHRILFAYPEPVPRKWSGAELRPETCEGFDSLFLEMRRVPTSNTPGDDSLVLPLSLEAKKEWVSWVTRHNSEFPELPSSLRGPWSKMISYCARFVLILHVAKSASEETFNRQVGKESVSSAILLAEYFKSHARKVYQHVRVEARDQRLAAAIEWIRSQPAREVSRRQVVTAGVAGCRNNESADVLFGDLEAAGWGKITRQKPKTGGRTKVGFRMSDGDG